MFQDIDTTLYYGKYYNPFWESVWTNLYTEIVACRINKLAETAAKVGSSPHKSMHDRFAETYFKKVTQFYANVG